MKYNLKGLNILVKNEEESEFVLKLAWENNYVWRNGDTTENENNRLSGHVYREGKTSNGEFIYCFDYLKEEERVLSCFSDYDNIEELISIYNLKLVEASEIINMGDAAKNLFLTLR
jgi:hypothetical protein